MRQHWRIVGSMVVLVSCSLPAECGVPSRTSRLNQQQKTSTSEKTESVDATHLFGTGVSEWMPTCGNIPPFRLAPVDLNHVISLNTEKESNLVYFHLKSLEPERPDSPRVTTTVFAPCDLRIAQVDTYTYLSANPPHSEHTVIFYGCTELRTSVSKLITLDFEITRYVGSSAICNTYWADGAQIQYCFETTNISILEGEPLGTVGGKNTKFGFGTTDSRRASEKPDSGSPLNYFELPLQMSLEKLVHE